ncbi:hypothetical protein FRACA_360009 [Frankia canadensis]|uniref:Uncharacterized protein n=1 Tax=Frankia canadensis TaxID=1836972 RepID=A0A2I2KVH5_9ACTN|nr:hypothetical protein FRACA_360009 [Frankia canadensis]SOU56946.1 hypothetical protein FRACA_360009 [Frankia canadensis]
MPDRWPRHARQACQRGMSMGVPPGSAVRDRAADARPPVSTRASASEGPRDGTGGGCRHAADPDAAQVTRHGRDVWRMRRRGRTRGGGTPPAAAKPRPDGVRRWSG